MLIKFIEWYFTVGGFATLFAFTVQGLAGTYAAFLIRDGQIDPASDKICGEITILNTKQDIGVYLAAALFWYAFMWVTWMYNVPSTVSYTYTWIRKLNRAKVRS